MNKKHKKIIMLTVVGLITVFILLFSYFIIIRSGNKYRELPSNFKLKMIATKIEVFRKLTYQNMILEHDGILVNNSQILKTDQLGKQEIKLYFEHNKKRYEKKISIEIVDTIDPVILGSGTRTIEVGYDQEIKDLFMIADNYDKKPKVNIIGEYDVNQIGEYPLQIEAIDKSNNQTRIEVLLIVQEKQIKQDIVKPKTVAFQTIYDKYKTSQTEIGLDLSKWQKEVDMNKIKEQGVSFVILRVGVHAGKGYDIKKDEYFDANLKNAKEAGLKIGVYFYSTATSEDEAKKQAKWVLKQIKKEKLDFPIVYDWENWNYWNHYDISLNDFNNIAEAFIKEVKKKDYKGMIYGSKYYLENVFSILDDYPVWLAHYTKNIELSSYDGKYQLWQVTDQAIIDGINNTVDVNVYYK